MKNYLRLALNGLALGALLSAALLMFQSKSRGEPVLLLFAVIVGSIGIFLLYRTRVTPEALLLEWGLTVLGGLLGLVGTGLTFYGILSFFLGAGGLPALVLILGGVCCALVGSGIASKPKVGMVPTPTVVNNNRPSSVSNSTSTYSSKTILSIVFATAGGVLGTLGIVVGSVIFVFVGVGLLGFAVWVGRSI